MEAHIDFLRTIRRRYRVICGITIGATLIFVAAAFVMRPVYRSAVVFSIVTEDSKSSLSQLTRQVPIAALSGFLGTARGSDREEALAVLRSRNFTESFIKRHDLMPKLFAREWDPSTRNWRDPEDAPTIRDAFRLFDRKIRRITEDRVTGIVTLSIDWRDPSESSEWANALISDADSHLRTNEIREADRSEQYLRNEISRTTVVELQSALYRLLEEQVKRSMLAKVRDQFALKVIDPAVTADRKDFVKPNRLAMAIIGFLFGVIAGVGYVLVREALRQQTAAI